jgi:mannose-1-phosphate guanylyltransferase
MIDDNAWAIVLAGGEGERVRNLTVDPVRGTRIPKQYFSFFDGPSLLETTLRRARGVVKNDRILVVVLESHSRFWQPALAGLPRENVLVQPTSRGTAVGVGAPLLHLLGRAPSSRFVLFPSDHHVDDEYVMKRAVEVALGRVTRDPARPILLGITADRADSQYGWIVPARALVPGGVGAVRKFVEKPEHLEAESLFVAGALWSSMMMVGDTARMANLLEVTAPELRRGLPPSLAAAPWTSKRGVSAWEMLPHRDFSRDVLMAVASELDVMAVPPCGWSDLGTPERVAAIRAARLEGAEAGES